MTDATREPVEVVRARRFELIDDDGLVRAVIGRMGQHEGQGLYGLGLKDAAGERIRLMTGPFGPNLIVVGEGNEVIMLGVEESDDAILPGPRFMLCDLDGVPQTTMRTSGGERLP